MTTILKPKEKYVPSGDIPEELLEYLKPFNPKNATGVIPLNLNTVCSACPWQGLVNLDINVHKLQTQSIYKDAVTHHEAYWFLPTILVTTDPAKYKSVDIFKNPTVYNFFSDIKWHKAIWRKELFKLSRIQKILLGTGYTLGCYINDGAPGGKFNKQGEPEPSMVAVDLNNGDQIAGFVWEWYNK
jgi:hypothetical protein